jgi:hypothetical protein
MLRLADRIPDVEEFARNGQNSSEAAFLKL